MIKSLLCFIGNLLFGLVYIIIGIPLGIFLFVVAFISLTVSQINYFGPFRS